MLLNSIRIERDRYGALKDSYEVTINVEENHNEIKFRLPPEASEAFVRQAKDLIHKFTVRAADQLHRELQIASPAPVAELPPSLPESNI